MGVGVSESTAGDLAENLRERFGFDCFLPGQREVMELLVAGNSAAAVFPTGGGKSLCYQLPALTFPGVTLVVSPLIALMKDQIDALTARGIAAVRFDSSLTSREYREAVERLRSGHLRLVYVAPERFNNERFRLLLGQTRVSLFAVDEAHCISEWGHNFRPDYLKLARYAKECRAERRFALTATAPPRVLEDICREFDIPARCAVRTGFYRPNLTLRTTPVPANQRDALLLERLKERPAGATIVYVTLQRTAEEVAQLICRNGIEARPYHARLSSELRSEIQEWFLTSERAVIVATIAFGMGIDKPDIRYVYHYNLAKSLENYSQEIGRAGRDGRQSICESLVCTDDLRTLENFVYGDTPDPDAVRALVYDLFGREAEFAVSLYELAQQHDIRDLVLRTLLTYLELDGYLAGGTPVYGQYQFKPLVTSAELLAHFAGERREFLTRLLRQSRKGRTWMTLQIDAAVDALHTDRSRVVRAMDYLAERGWVELQSAKVQHQYRRLRMPEDKDGLASQLFDRCLHRQEQDLGRLQQLQQLIELDSCQTNALASHFGEIRDQSCGHCNWCLENRQPVDVPPPEYPIIDQEIWRQAVQYRQQHLETLSSPRSFARFLCGVRSPHLSRARLTREPLFGALCDVPFDEVLKQAEG